MRNDLSNLPALRAGMIVFFKNGPISWLIQYFAGRGPSHVGIVCDPENICEALGKVVIQPIRPRLKRGWREIWEFDWVDEEDAAFILAKCKEYEGRSYGWWKLLFHAVGLQALTFWDRHPVCSFFVAGLMNDLKKAKFGDPRATAFGMSRGAAQPDDMHQYVVADSFVSGETSLVWRPQSPMAVT